MITELQIEERHKAYEYYLSNEIISIREAERTFNFTRGTLDRYIVKNNLYKKNGTELTSKLNSIHKKCKIYTRLSNNELNILEGYVLSDGGIYKSTATNTARLNIVNTNKAFCDYAAKYLPFNSLVKLQRKAATNVWVAKAYSNTKDLYAYYSKADLVLEELQEKWYINKIKILPENFTLSPLKVLIWFLGDGFSSHCRKQVTVGLCVNNFSFEEINRMIDLFKDIDINFRIKNANNCTTYMMQIYESKSIINFYNYIGNCPDELSCFSYKWKSKR